MRVFGFIQKKDEFKPLAKRVEREGNRVAMVSKGNLYPRPDVVVLHVGNGEYANSLVKEGYAVIGSSKFGDSVELDYHYALSIMKLAGIKPLMDELNGVEIEVEIWFNGVNVVGLDYRMKDQKLMNDDIGPKVNMGNSIVQGKLNDRLYAETLEKIVPTLRKVNFRGSFRLSALVTKDMVYGSIFNTHLDLDAFYEIHMGKINNLLYGIASGVIMSVKMREDWAMSVTLAQIESDKYMNREVEGINEYNKKHMWLYGIEGGKVVGRGGKLATVTAKGVDLREARRRAYRTIRNIKIIDLMYRTDIGMRAYKEYALLKQWGWIG